MCIFKTIDEQITILQERGLTIHSKERAKKYLLTSNYYAIINGYGKFFQDYPDHFIPGATFDEVRQLYLFDKEFKEILLKGILDAEHHLKSISAYRFAEANPNVKYPYLDIHSYNPNHLNYDWKLISKLSKILSSNCEYANNPIHHNVHCHRNVPIWVLVAFLDFGTLKAFIKDLPIQVQNKIAVDCLNFILDNVPNFNSSFTPKVMNSFIKNIAETRNICAHNNRLLKFQCRSDVSYFEALHQKYGIQNINGTRKNVYTTFVCLRCFLSKDEYIILNNSLRKRIRRLEHNLSSVEINLVLSSLGFPNNWHKHSALQN